MNSLNNIEGNNFITEDNHEKHVIKKYEFRSMDKKLEAQIAPAMEENGFYTPNEGGTKIEGIEHLQEQINKTLEENQKIFQKLEFFQELLQKKENIDPAVIEELKAGEYQRGLNDGEQKIKEFLEAQMQEQKEKMIYAIKELEKNAQVFGRELEQIKNDLSAIALDLAKEVILKEIDENASKIALQIAQELLRPLEQNTEITLKANPLDLPFLEEKLSPSSNIKFEADSLIARGGVILSSSKGNFDGTILSRYRNLKRSILDEKGL